MIMVMIGIDLGGTGCSATARGAVVPVRRMLPTGIADSV
jgi:N-acetylglucosamine kinase-like BadF-type ATPase